MIIPDLKKASMTVMAKRSGKGEKLSGPAPMKTEETLDEDGEVDGRHAAAEDALAAFHEKSPQKFMEAMANFIDLHNMKKPEPEPSDDDEY